jgi:uncharacterized LabA/DUF88 family protein
MTENGSPLLLLSRFAIMVDVGYIYACAGELLFGAASRREYRVDADGLIQALTRHAEEIIRGELLRVYWYDAARDRVPTIDQRVIAQMPWVKLRLGNLNARGQQKGVDAQIRADMEVLARHRAVTDTILVAGDEDMVPAVEAAQAFGVRVHLWGVEPPYGTNQAERLVWESDTVEVLERAFVEPFFSRYPEPATDDTARRADGPLQVAHAAAEQALAEHSLAGRALTDQDLTDQDLTGQTVTDQALTDQALTDQVLTSRALAGQALAEEALAEEGIPVAPSPAQVFGERHTPRQAAAARPAPGGHSQTMAWLGPDRERVEEAGEHVAQKWILTRGEDNIRDLLPGPILPPVIDKELLVEAEKELGLSLRPYQEAREWLRDAFWTRVHRQFGIGAGPSRG